MKNASVFSLVFILLLVLCRSENISASVCCKKGNGMVAASPSCMNTGLKNQIGFDRKELEIKPFRNLAIMVFKWAPYRWMERNFTLKKHQQVRDSTANCFKIRKRTGGVVLASTFNIEHDSIKYTLCNSLDSSFYSLSIKAVDQIEGSDGFVFYGGNRGFQYLSVVSIFSTVFGYLFFAVLPGLAALLLLLSIISGIVSLVRLRKHRERYDGVRKAYFFTLLSLFLSLVVPLTVVMVIFSSFG
jgi:hypothetical protein